ncbi:hypothetical protein H0H93_001333 [Arthromyces matolae]|nr:hypothetical protein H0H93_001333 [Arthromyces matolae]
MATTMPPTRPQYLTIPPASAGADSWKSTKPFEEHEINFLRHELVNALLFAERLSAEFAIGRYPQDQLAMIKKRAHDLVNNHNKEYELSKSTKVSAPKTQQQINDLICYYRDLAMNSPSKPSERAPEYKMFRMVCAMNFVMTILKEVVYHSGRPSNASTVLHVEVMDEYRTRGFQEGIIKLPSSTGVQTHYQPPPKLREMFTVDEIHGAHPVDEQKVEEWRHQQHRARMIGLGVLFKDQEGNIAEMFYVRGLSSEKGYDYEIQFAEDESEYEDSVIPFTEGELFDKLRLPNAYWFRYAQ